MIRRGFVVLMILYRTRLTRLGKSEGEDEEEK